MKKFKIILLLSILIFISQTPIAYPSKAQSTNERFNMSYLYFGDPSTYINQINNTKGSLHVVTPNYFDITKSGELDTTWKLQTAFIDEMHSRGKKVVPFLSNHWNKTAGINGLINRDKLARDIADVIEEEDLDGINVDIEGINHEYRNEHTDFVRLLRKYIPNHKQVSVAVAANPSNWKTGWHGFYDYPGLAEHADYLFIMSYDESWDSEESPIGPVASIQFSDRSIKYALDQGVPRSKIVHGLPFYGRMWKLDGPTLKNQAIHGMGLSSTRVQPLVDKFNGKIHFDKKRGSSYATFTIPWGQHAFKGATKLTAGNYLIWYENEPSIKAKLSLTRKHDIKGAGSWALFHETSNTWDYYTRCLNAHCFIDVPNGHWAEEHILSVFEKGWMRGTSSTNFSLGANLTRAQGAVILVRALGYEGIKPKNYTFPDLSRHWAKDEIEVAREFGIVNGYPNNLFGPDDPLNREQLATILNNIFDSAENSATKKIQENPFSDIDPGDWSYDDILAIYNQGYIKGFGDGSFRPKATSTREQMAALMDRMSSNFLED